MALEHLAGTLAEGGRLAPGRDGLGVDETLATPHVDDKRARLALGQRVLAQRDRLAALAGEPRTA